MRSECAGAVGCARDSSPTCTIEPSGSMSRHSLPVSRQGLGLGLGGLSHDRGFLCRDTVHNRDRGFLCRDRVLLALCRDRGRCRDKIWLRQEGLVSQHINYVAIGRRNECALYAANEFCRDKSLFYFSTKSLTSVTT